MNSIQLFEAIRKKQSFLCIGLDSDIQKIPEFLMSTEDPVFEFNRRVIDSSAEFAVAYKPNLAFYESRGAEGLNSLIKTVNYLRSTYPDIFIIADAKRGDIGNTSKMYAKAFFDEMQFDAVTVAPYMGEDSVTPFLSYSEKWVILLALTSNKGADDFQYHTDSGERLFEKVLKKSASWGTKDNMMFVVGATRAEMLSDIRKIVPDHFLLIPGVGAQGGSLEEVVKYGINSKCGLLVNSSRAIIFADSSDNFSLTVASKAKEVRDEMSSYLKEYHLI
jgi:orotidine-5'-phosphate decarboxylase